MKRRSLLIALSLIAVAILMGCSGNGLYLSTNTTAVNLEEPNYKVIATNITGKATSGYLLGFSFSWGAATESFALYRVNGNGMQYQEALKNFWENFEKEHGSPIGRSLGLVNVRYDADVANAVFYTENTVIITADVVEFTE